MGTKKSFVLRIDQDSYEKLERWAADEFRSVNGQIEWILRKSLKESGRLNKSADVNPANDEKLDPTNNDIS